MGGTGGGSVSPEGVKSIWEELNTSISVGLGSCLEYVVKMGYGRENHCQCSENFIILYYISILLIMKKEGKTSKIMVVAWWGNGKGKFVKKEEIF